MIGLVTYQLAYPVVIVRSRLLTIGRDYEEAAIDLGASPLGAVRRVLLGFLAYRWFTRGEQRGRNLDAFAGEA